MKTQLALLATALALILAACAPAATPTLMPEPTQAPTPAPTPTPEPLDIVDTAIADGRFTTLAAALQAAGLVDTLKGEGPFTVFAPTDDAFAKLPAGTVEALLADLPTLTSILTYHVVAGKVMAADVVGLDGQRVATVNGKGFTVKLQDGKVFVDNAEVIITDIETANGVIHVIDSVIIPQNDIIETAAADGRFTTLLAAVQAAGLVDTLKGEGPFTVFAPTDDAFAKLPAGTVEALLADLPTLTSILTYHVVPGKVMAADVVGLDGQRVTTVNGKGFTVKLQDGKVFIDNAEVIITDIETYNGVIHVIDTVIIPQKDIVETAVADGRFTTLVAAVTAADLVETLQGEGPFTVFAPTDDAFAKLPAGTIEELLKPENKQTLINILLYHVVPGKVMAADVVGLNGKDVVTALEGQTFKVTVSGGKVFLNGNIQVIITDIETYNGVIHVIDTVLLPK